MFTTLHWSPQAIKTYTFFFFNQSNFTKLAKYGKNAQRQLDETGRFPI